MLEVSSTLPGEREVGFGGTTTHLFSYTNKMGILWNPCQPPSSSEGTDEVWIRGTGQPSGDWWGASVAYSNSYYRLVSLHPGNPAGLRTGQFPGGLTGNWIHWAYEGFKNYEAFIAAVPYDGTMAARVTVNNGWATVHAPKAGTYSLYTRAVSGRRHTYTPAKTSLTLSAGATTGDVRGLSLFRPHPRAGIEWGEPARRPRAAVSQREFRLTRRRKVSERVASYDWMVRGLR